jgi:hypothetical protein
MSNCVGIRVSVERALDTGLLFLCIAASFLLPPCYEGVHPLAKSLELITDVFDLPDTEFLLTLLVGFDLADSLRRLVQESESIRTGRGVEDALCQRGHATDHDGVACDFVAGRASYRRILVTEWVRRQRLELAI